MLEFKTLRVMLMVLGPLPAVAVDLWYWFRWPGVVETDIAYIKQDIMAVAGEVSGLATQVNVRENQHVQAGQVLFMIYAATFSAVVQQADAQIAWAQPRISALRAYITAKAAELAGAHANLALAQAHYSRVEA